MPWYSRLPCHNLMTYDTLQANYWNLTEDLRNSYLVLILSQVVITKRNRIRFFCCREAMSAANSLDSISFLITTRLSWDSSLRDGSGLGGRDSGLGEASGDTGGVRPSLIFSSEFSVERESVCLFNLLLVSLRFLFWGTKRFAYKMSIWLTGDYILNRILLKRLLGELSKTFK